MKFHEMLNELREEKFLTKTALGKEIGTSRQQISLFESGQVMPTSETLLAIADYFEVSTDYLLGREKNVTVPTGKESAYIMLCERLTDEERSLVRDFANFLIKRRT